MSTEIPPITSNHVPLVEPHPTIPGTLQHRKLSLEGYQTLSGDPYPIHWMPANLTCQMCGTEANPFELVAHLEKAHYTTPAKYAYAYPGYGSQLPIATR